jgi:hypothetical protein
MRIWGCIVAVTWLAANGFVELQTQPTDAARVLAATREALGGDKRLSSVQTFVTTGRTRQVRGESLVPIEFEIMCELPDKFIRIDDIPAQESGPTTVGFNGGDLIQFPQPAGPTPRGPAGPGPAGAGVTAAQIETARGARLVAVKQDFARLMLGMFAASFTPYPLTFTYAGTAEAPQGKADVLDVKGPANFSARMFVHRETHLPLLVSWVQQGPAGPGRIGGPRPTPPGQTPPSAQPVGQPAQGAQVPAAATPATPAAAAAQPIESRMYYGEYRDVNGMQWPFRIRRAAGPDTVEETTFDRFKVNAKIDPAKFAVKK